jgi:hypothetical protein
LAISPGKGIIQGKQEKQKFIRPNFALKKQLTHFWIVGLAKSINYCGNSKNCGGQAKTKIKKDAYFVITFFFYSQILKHINTNII